MEAGPQNTKTQEENLEEEKTTIETKKEYSHDLKAAMEELGIDPLDPRFSEERMLGKFASISND